MEIRFSGVPLRVGCTPEQAVQDSAEVFAVACYVTWARGDRVRFRLPSASEHEHDLVIGELFKYDADATIRTARAIFEGKSDFESQLKARLSTGANQQT